MRKTILTVLVVTILITASLAFAQGWGRGAGVGYGSGPRMNSGLYGPCLTSGLTSAGWRADFDLTPEQIQKVQTLREAHWKKITPLQSDLTNKRFELRSLWSQPNPDQENILAIQKEINALQAKIRDEATKHYLEMRQILTPDQQAKLSATFEGFGAGPGFGKKGGFGPGRGMGYGPCFW